MATWISRTYITPYMIHHLEGFEETVEGIPGRWFIYKNGLRVSGEYKFQADAKEAVELGIYELHDGVKA